MAYLMHLGGGLNEMAMFKMFTRRWRNHCDWSVFVWLKIGRKLRALYVILRPQSSWMSREVYA